jgi:hypothetical protein
MNDLQLSNAGVSGQVRIWLRAEGFAVLALSLLLYRASGPSWWVFLALFLTPDIVMLFYLINPKVGGFSYNVVHSYLLPLGLAALAVFLHESGMLAYLYIWTAHIGLDRFLGYGLKYPVAFGKTHLGDLARSPVKPSAPGVFQR